MFHWKVTFGTCAPTGLRGTHIFIVAAPSASLAQETASSLADSADAAFHRRGALLDAQHGITVERWHGDPLCRL